ncbi:6-phosphogluconolactonase [Lysobacter fragariae]
MAWLEHDYVDAGALAAGVAIALESTCVDGLATRGRATLALAGGRTPWPAYERLATKSLAWSNVTVMPSDERCVPHDHPACNLRGMRDIFASAAGLRIESLTTPNGDPDRSQAHAQAMLAALAEPFDAVVLGMGNDAHTASLFPGAVQLAAALDPASNVDACRIDPDPLPPEAPFPRITLTAPRLLRTRSMHLVLTGEGKLEVLRRAQAENDPLRHPVAAVLHAPDVLVQIHWSP